MQAPALKLPNDEGKMVDLADYRGRPVMITFLSHAA
jgi:peroxiredoxin